MLSFHPHAGRVPGVGSFPAFLLARRSTNAPSINVPGNGAAGRIYHNSREVSDRPAVKLGTKVSVKNYALEKKPKVIFFTVTFCNKRQPLRDEKISRENEKKLHYTHFFVEFSTRLEYYLLKR